VVRGGSWLNDSTVNFRAANRFIYGINNLNIGFRCVRSS